MTEQSDRIDSWKAIADYLGRDIRTLRRWELQGLPIHRVPGGRGHSVFAYRAEVDEWFRAAGDLGAVAESVAQTPSDARPAQLPQASAPRHRSGRLGQSTSIVGVSILIVGVVMWQAMAPRPTDQALSVNVTELGVVATDPAGRERWRYAFADDVRTYPPRTAPASLVMDGVQPGVFVATANTLSRSDRIPASGALRWFTPAGRLTQTFVFDDLLKFAGQRSFSAPWALTDFRVNQSGGRRRLAVAAHHYVWWPSVVTIVDANWQRQGTFVNSGWVESLLWLTPERLAIAGFNEARNGGMVALLDAGVIDGSSPEDPASEFHCETCGPGRPLSYFVFPRSELNRVTGSAFNRAAVSVTGGRVLARTEELDRHDAGPSAEAIYEFSASLEFLSARYGDRYWDRHRVLERQGEITHTRENCPERDGPPSVLMWDQANGWRTIKAQAPRS